MIVKQICIWGGRVILGLLVIGCLLLWIDRQTDKREKSAFKQGYSQCEAKFAKGEAKKIEKEKEVQNEKSYKKAVIWSNRAIDDDDTQRLYDSGIL